MPVISIHNAGAFGLVSDEPDHELPPEAWSDAQNIRFGEGYACKFLGHTSFTTPTVPPYWLLHVREPGTPYWIYPGLQEVYVTDGSTHKKISKTGTPPIYSATEADGWTGGVLGGIPVLNNAVDPPQMWNPVDFATPGLLADLSNWPASTTAKVLRVFRNFLVAFDITKTSTRFPHMVKWSSPADPGAVPPSWDETDATEQAGEFHLSPTTGRILDGVSMRDLMILYKESSIHRMQFTEGVFVFHFSTAFEELGALSRRCAQVLRDRHVVFGFEDIAVHDGQRAESIVQRRIRRHIYNSLDGANYGLSFIAPLPTRQELWFCYPTTGATRPNQAVVWNMRENTWGVRDLPSSAHIGYGVVNIGANATWSSISETWAAVIRTWDEEPFNPADLGLLGAGPADTDLFRFDDGNLADGAAMTVRLERTGLALVGRTRQGQPRVDFDSMKMVKRIRPRMTATGAVTITVGSQVERGGAVTWGTPQSFNPNTDTKVDVVHTGRLLAVKFESTTDIDWKLYGYDLDIELVGRN